MTLQFADDRLAMQRACDLAARGIGAVEPNPPVGAVVVDSERQLLGEGFHESFGSAHAEVIALRNAGEKTHGATLFVTLEPCAMCAGAIAHARIAKLYYAAPDSKGGGVEHGARVFDHPQCLHRPEVYAGIAEQEAAELLRAFFRERR